MMAAAEQTKKTLARLSFWVQPTKKAAFEDVFEKQLRPLLKKHRLIKASNLGRSTAEEVFSRLFEVDLAEIGLLEQAIQKDPAWQEVLRTLGLAYGNEGNEGSLRYRFGLYSTPSKDGKAVEVGAGFRHGLWQNFSVRDGLPSSMIISIYPDRAGGIWFGTPEGVSRYDGKTFVTYTTEEGLAHNRVTSILEDRKGSFWFGTPAGVSRFDGAVFDTFSSEDGLGSDRVESIFEDREGHLWFGTWGSGVSCFDGQEFTHFTTADGLVHNYVETIFEDRKGHIWTATRRGVSRYDGKRFDTFTSEEGLGSNTVESIYEDRQGHLWFGTTPTGVSRYDGSEFVTFSTDDGLASNRVLFILEDQEDHLWFGTDPNGVTRYDGSEFVTFSTDDGLASNQIWSIAEDMEGNIWIGTWGGGVSRYDQGQFQNYTTKDGLVNNGMMSIIEDDRGHLWLGTWGGVSHYDGSRFSTLEDLTGKNVACLTRDRKDDLWFGFSVPYGGVSRFDGKTYTNFTEDFRLHSEGYPTPSVYAHVVSMLEDREGHLWFGTWGSGVSCFDGQEFTHFTTADGLVHNHVETIFEDRKGHLWFGTYGGGISRYDGFVFQTLSRQDGLAHDAIQQILQDRHGHIWVATEGGLSRYRPHQKPPVVYLTEVIADRRYGSVEEVHLPVSQEFVTFEFQGWSFTTHPDRMVYVYRLKGKDSTWQVATTGQVSYQGLVLGDYTFQVKTVDRDLNYSKPAVIQLKVVPDSRDERIDALEVRVRERTLELEEKNRDLEEANRQIQEANQAKSRFLANMSHEIRTPMNAILGYAQLLQRRQDLSPDQRDAVATIASSGNHLLNLINDVLDLSKIEAGHLELNPVDFDLHNLLQTLATMFALRCEQEQLSWQIEGLGNGPLPVHGDEAKLGQVLINLLGNAVKFTGKGTVALGLCQLRGAQYRFEVIDTGQGIPPTEQQALFEPFHQGAAGQHQGGTGLGLAISQRLLALMGSQLELNSTPGQGSRFFFTLTLPPTTGVVPRSQEAINGQVLHLKEGCAVEALVVDDVRENLDVLTGLLESVGVAVRQATSGADALALIDQAHPDIVFIDIRMPEMDGMETTRRLWAQWGREAMRVVAISASVLGHQRQDYLDFGFDAFIEKPFRVDQLYTCLAQQLEVEYEYAALHPEAGPTDSTPLIAPPAAELATLFELAQQGLIVAIGQHIDRLEQQDAIFAPFAAALRRCAQGFNTEEICAFLIPYLEDAP